MMAMYRFSACTGTDGTPSNMSEVEEALNQIRNFKGVEGYVIADSNGNVLRRHPQMQSTEAEKYALYMKELAVKAHGVVRDINPEVFVSYENAQCLKLRS